MQTSIYHTIWKQV